MTETLTFDDFAKPKAATQPAASWDEFAGGPAPSMKYEIVPSDVEYPSQLEAPSQLRGPQPAGRESLASRGAKRFVNALILDRLESAWVGPPPKTQAQFESERQGEKRLQAYIHGELEPKTVRLYSPYFDPVKGYMVSGKEAVRDVPVVQPKLGDVIRRMGGEIAAIPKLHGAIGAAKAQRLAEVRAVAEQTGTPMLGYNIPQSITIGEKAVDISAGLAAFIVQYAVAKKLIGPELANTPLGTGVAFEMAGMGEAPVPGEGMLTGMTLGAIGQLRAAGKVVKAAKVGASSVALGSMAAMKGAELEDIVIAALIPPALASIGVLKAKFRKTLRGVKDARALKRALPKMRADALAELGLKGKPSFEQVRSALHRVAKQRHPDLKGPEADARAMQDAKEAYDFLVGRRPAYQPKPKPVPKAKPRPGEIVKRPAEIPAPKPIEAKPLAKPAPEPAPTIELAKPALPAEPAKQPWEMGRIDYGRAEVERLLAQAKTELPVQQQRAKSRRGKREYKAMAKKDVARLERIIPEYERILRENDVGQLQLEAGRQHSDAIRNALEQGQAVSRAVLEEYKGEKWADAALAKMEPAAAPKEGVEEPTGWQQTVNQAKQNLKEKLGRTTLRTGVDPTILKDVAVVVADYIKQGAVKLVDVIKRIRTEFGKAYVPHARRAFRDLRREAVKIQAVDSARQRLLAPLATEARKVHLRRGIREYARMKGMTHKSVAELTKKYGGVANVMSKRLGVPELEAIRTAVRRHRPRTIGGQTVVTPKTEAAIGELRKNLYARDQMTNTDFERILKDMNISAPKYVAGEKLLTEQKAHELLKRMNIEARLIGEREARRKSLEANPEIKAVYDDIGKRITKKRVAREAKGKGGRAGTLRDMRYTAALMQETTGGPFYDSWRKVIETRDNVHAATEAEWKALAESSPQFEVIAADADASLRIVHYIESQLPEGPPKPKDITPEEIKVASAVQKLLQGYEGKVQLARFYDYYYQGTPVPEHLNELYGQARDSFDQGGLPALESFLSTHPEWGVIRAGYSPWTVLKPRLGTRRLGPAIYGSKRHIRPREPGYREQDDNLWTRLNGYMRKMRNLTEIQPEVNALAAVYDQYFVKFSRVSADKAHRALTNAISEAMGNVPREGGWLERIYAQAASAVFLDVRKAFRNLWQNPAFNEDMQNPANLRFLWSEYSDADKAYFKARVSQSRGMLRDYLMQQEKPLVPVLTQLAHKIPLYRASDEINRTMAFRVRLGKVRQALRTYDKTGDVEKLLRQSGVEGLEPLQQMEALDRLARNGKEDFARFAAAQHTANVHFKYDRAQRAVKAMGIKGRIIANLLTFPRSWAQRIAFGVKKIATGRTRAEKWRGARVVIQMTAGAYFIGELYKWITGDDRNPYAPGNIAGWQPGGLTIGAASDASALLSDIYRGLMGDKLAMDRALRGMSRVAKLFIPFYDEAVHFVEAITNKRIIDVYGLRRIREALDSSYKTRREAYEAKRDLIESIQHGVFGRQNEPPAKRGKAKPKGRTAPRTGSRAGSRTGARGR